MKDKKIFNPKHVLILSVFVFISTIFFSNIKGNSHKLPAIIKTDDIHIISEASGVVKEYYSFINDKTLIGQKILKIENPELLKQIEDLSKEKDKYEELLYSASKGDFLKLETMDIDDQIMKLGKKLNMHILQKKNIINQLQVYTEKFMLAKNEYEAYKNLYENGMISSGELDEKSTNFLEISNSYNQLQSDSTFTIEEISVTRNSMNLLNEQKNIIIKNISVVAPGYYLKIEDIKFKLNQLEREAEHLEVKSPAEGIITNVFFDLGENITKGETIAKISMLKNIWVIAYGNSFSQKNVRQGMKVIVYSDSGEKVTGKVKSISPIMKKIKSLASASETANTYTEIEIIFDDMELAKEQFTPGERLFVNIIIKGSA